MAINRAKISLKLYNQLSKKGLLKSVNILRNDKNVFGERVKDLYVCTVKGYYHRSDLKVTIQSADGGSINGGYEDKLLLTNSEESRKIMRDDYFILDGITYQIIDLGNVEDIVYDMSLKRMC